MNQALDVLGWLRSASSRVGAELQTCSCRLIMVVVMCLFVTRLFAHGDLLEIIAAVTMTIAEHPNDAELYLARGKLYRYDENWSAALADLDHAAALAPTMNEVDLSRGLTLHDAGREAEALVAFNRFLAAVPRDVEGLMGRAQVLGKMGRNANAIADLRTAENVDNHPSPQLYLDWAECLHANAAPPAETLAVLERGMLRLGRVVSLDQAALSVEVDSEAYLAALTRLERLIAAAERPEGWLLQRGDLLARLGRNEDAVADYRGGLAALELLGSARRQAAATRAIEASLHAGLDGRRRRSTAGGQ